jgi:hypothetical protein
MAIETDNALMKGEGKRGRWHKLTGVLLAVIGFFWLAKKAGWMPTEHSHSAIFWPIVVIAAGLFIFFSSRHRHTA